MSIHVCKQCGRRFEYCRACVFRPIRYMDAGFCTKKCQEESKNNIEEVIQKDVEVVIDEDTSTSKEEVVVSSFFSAKEIVDGSTTDASIGENVIQINDPIVENVEVVEEVVEITSRKKKNKEKKIDENQ